jgi:hypothetical protein
VRQDWCLLVCVRLKAHRLDSLIVEVEAKCNTRMKCGLREGKEPPEGCNVVVVKVLLVKLHALQHSQLATRSPSPFPWLLAFHLRRHCCD